MGWLDRIPLWVLALGAVFMAFAPTIIGFVLMPLSWLMSGDAFGFYTEPHLWRDLKWLVAGELTRPEDIFDLFWHGTLPVLLVIRLVRDARRRPAN